MTDIIHADIFFFVATLALIAISVLVAIALTYLIILLRRLNQTSKDAANIVSRIKKFFKKR
ncbi:MAG: hypothetical protein AAB364_01685 [Patescibacteria group bacterium]